MTVATTAWAIRVEPQSVGNCQLATGEYTGVGGSLSGDGIPASARHSSSSPQARESDLTPKGVSQDFKNSMNGGGGIRTHGSGVFRRR